MIRKNGISLIVLVITIIVIIILAGSVILSLAENNPIATANEATAKTNFKSYESSLSQYLTEQFTSNLGNYDVTKLKSVGNTIQYDGNILTGESVTTIASVKSDEANDYIIANGKLTYIKKDSIKLKQAREVGIDAAPIPTGFEYLEGSVNEGLVVRDTTLGNEFVWVPVDGVNVSYANIHTLDTLPTGVVSDSDQITKYGGFYVARYEAGINGTAAVSKKNINPWINITYVDSKTKSELMYNNSELKSGLLSANLSITIGRWLVYSGFDINNSLTWGNHKDSDFYFTGGYSINNGTSYISGTNIRKAFDSAWLLNTGVAEVNKTKNIFDLAGNLSEWVNMSSKRNFYAGAYVLPSYLQSYNFSTTTSIGASGYYIGFRTVLYML